MGYITDALLWYGVNLTDGGNEAIETTVAQHPNFWLDDGRAWFAERGLNGVSVVTHCHSEAPQYGIAICSTVQEAARGDAVVLDGRFTERHPTGTMRQFILSALDVLGIEHPEGIGWCLASFHSP